MNQNIYFITIVKNVQPNVIIVCIYNKKVSILQLVNIFRKLQCTNYIVNVIK